MSIQEKIRQENILRNKTFLNSIGLGLSNVESTNISKKNKRSERVQTVVLRRSLRSVEPSNSGNSNNVELETSSDESNSSIRRVKSKLSSNSFIPKCKSIGNVASSTTGVSCRDSVAYVENFLNTDVLGNPLKDFGKVAVITLACVAANGKSAIPKFNKFSGILQWKNCLFLWINVERKYTAGSIIGNAGNGNSYDNEFDVISDTQCNLTWYGNNRMKLDSDLTKLIMKNKVDPISSKVLLFVRIVGENYAPFGLVQCLKYDIVNTPEGEQLKFTFQLMQFESIYCKQYVRSILIENLAITPTL